MDEIESLMGKKFPIGKESAVHGALYLYMWYNCNNKK